MQLGEHLVAQLQKPENIQKVTDWIEKPENAKLVMSKISPQMLQSFAGAAMGDPMAMLMKAKDWFMSQPLDVRVMLGGGALAGTLGLGSMLMGNTGLGLGLGAAGAAAIGGGLLAPQGGYWNAHAQATPGDNAAGGASVNHSQEPLYSEQGALDPDAAAAQQHEAQRHNELEAQRQQQQQQQQQPLPPLPAPQPQPQQSV